MISGCLNCTNTQACAECNTTGNYILLLNNTCSLCPGGYFANQSSDNC